MADVSAGELVPQLGGELGGAALGGRELGGAELGGRVIGRSEMTSGAVPGGRGDGGGPSYSRFGATIVKPRGPR